MDRYTSLDDVLAHIWTYVEDAASDPEHPFRTPTFGTVAAEGPNLRTVVLRRAGARARVLAFHTDRRSRKMEEIRANERIAWHGWDRERSEQIRLFGTASVHSDDELADDTWAQEGPETLKLYVRASAPGTPLDSPSDGLQASVKKETLTREDVADGRSEFAVVQTTIDEIYWLHLHPEGHYRARFRWDPEQQAFEGAWVSP